MATKEHELKINSFKIHARALRQGLVKCLEKSRNETNMTET